MATIQNIKIWKDEDGNYLCRNNETGEVINLGKITLKIPIYMSEATENAKIEELELSARSTNGLKHVGIETVGELIERIDGIQDLKNMRRIGTKSAEEIMDHLMQYQYEVMKSTSKERYLKRVMELNKIEFMKG